MPREQRDQQKDPLTQIVGNVGREPESRDARGKTVVGFTVACTRSYDRDDDSTEWFDVSVWNEDLQRVVKQEVGKGDKVAIEGFETSREYQGRTYKNINATRVGFVDWLRKDSARTPAPASAPETDDTGDDLPF